MNPLLKVAFDESVLLGGAVEFDQRTEQFLHTVERHRVRPVGFGLRRVGVRLHEKARDADRNRRAREHWNKLALSAARSTLPAWQLYRMRSVEYDGCAGVAHDCQR